MYRINLYRQIKAISILALAISFSVCQDNSPPPQAAGTAPFVVVLQNPDMHQVGELFTVQMTVTLPNGSGTHNHIPISDPDPNDVMAMMPGGASGWMVTGDLEVTGTARAVTDTLTRRQGSVVTLT